MAVVVPVGSVSYCIPLCCLLINRECRVVCDALKRQIYRRKVYYCWDANSVMTYFRPDVQLKSNGKKSRLCLFCIRNEMERHNLSRTMPHHGTLMKVCSYTGKSGVSNGGY